MPWVSRLSASVACRVALGRQAAFTDCMDHVARSRRRTGALAWWLYQNENEPDGRSVSPSITGFRPPTGATRRGPSADEEGHDSRGAPCIRCRCRSCGVEDGGDGREEHVGATRLEAGPLDKAVQPRLPGGSTRAGSMPISAVPVQDRPLLRWFGAGSSRAPSGGSFRRGNVTRPCAVHRTGREAASREALCHKWHGKHG